MKKMTVLLMTALMLFLTACSGAAPEAETTAAAPAVLNMQELYETMSGAENMPEMLPLDADMQLMFCGIESTDCVQTVAAICADSLRADEIWLIEAVDTDALQRIQTLAENRLTAKAEESVTYSPEQYAIVQKAVVITHGNYFALLVSPEVDALEAIFRSAAGI
jgi:hypothetical protein